GKKNMEIQALLTQDEFVNLMKHIDEEEINAFITAGNVSEIYGTWNDNKKNKKIK
ncbi:MAG: DUF2179 domain-containing protein, partial [Bacteroidales bacterium]|nr:DUF2179 domain-containing protein [Bacteroidales bacterium]